MSHFTQNSKLKSLIEPYSKIYIWNWSQIVVLLVENKTKMVSGSSLWLHKPHKQKSLSITLVAVEFIDTVPEFLPVLLILY